MGKFLHDSVRSDFRKEGVFLHPGEVRFDGLVGGAGGYSAVVAAPGSDRLLHLNDCEKVNIDNNLINELIRLSVEYIS